MKVTQETTGENTATLKVEVSSEDYVAQIENKLRDYRKKANMPGFRPGQVPMSLVKKMYGGAIRADEIERAISQSLSQYIDENKLLLLGSPLPNEEKNGDIDWESDQGIVFYFDIALRPTIDVDLSQLSLTEYQITPTEKEVQDAITHLTKRFGIQEMPETIGETDLVYGKIEECHEDGGVKDGGIARNTSLEVSTIALKTIQKKFVGAKKGDSITFALHKAFKQPTDVAAMLNISTEEAKEFKSEVSFTVEAIHRVEPHAIDQALFSKAFPHDDLKTESDFAARVAKDLSDVYAKEMNPIFMDDAVKVLMDSVSFSTPDLFLKRWLKDNRKEGVSEADIEKDFESYRKSLQWQMVEGEIMQKYHISVSDQDIEDHYTQYFLSTYFPAKDGETAEETAQRETSARDIARTAISKEKQDHRVEDFLAEQKLIALFRSTCKINTKEMTLEAFKKEREAKATATA